MAFFIALSRVTGHLGSRIAAVAAALIMGFALWLSQSRTALVVVFLIGMFSFAKLAWRSRRTLYVTATVILLLAGVAIPVLQYLPSRFFDVTIPGGIRDRWLFISTTIGMLQWQPLFGVGVGQYVRWSGHFAPSDLLERQGPDNAHNNFAQVAGELGITGLLAFAFVLAISVWMRKHDRERSPLAAAVMPGVVAFILTWLGGHPLLVPEVTYPFWITLAIVPGVVAKPNALSWKPVAATALIGVILFLSIPFRIENKRQTFSHLVRADTRTVTAEK
jgi:O-antigen ligase